MIENSENSAPKKNEDHGGESTSPELGKIYTHIEDPAAGDLSLEFEKKAQIYKKYYEDLEKLSALDKRMADGEENLVLLKEEYAEAIGFYAANPEAGDIQKRQHDDLKAELDQIDSMEELHAFIRERKEMLADALNDIGLDQN